MKVISGNVRWMEGWGNRPTIEIAVDKLPDRSEFRYEQRDSLYYAELDGLVNFFSYSRPGEGYGGRRFDLVMTDGSKKTLVGPWSSRAGAMNSYGFGPCLDVSICEGEEAFNRRSFYAGAVTVELLKQGACLIDAGTIYQDKNPMNNQVRQGGYSKEFPSGSRFEIVAITEAGKRRSRAESSGEQTHAFGLDSSGDIRFEPAVRLSNSELWVKPGLKDNESIVEIGDLI